MTLPSLLGQQQTKVPSIFGAEFKCNLYLHIIYIAKYKDKTIGRKLSKTLSKQDEIVKLPSVEKNLYNYQVADEIIMGDKYPSSLHSKDKLDENILNSPKFNLEDIPFKPDSFASPRLLKDKSFGSTNDLETSSFSNRAEHKRGNKGSHIIGGLVNEEYEADDAYMKPRGSLTTKSRTNFVNLETIMQENAARRGENIKHDAFFKRILNRRKVHGILDQIVTDIQEEDSSSTLFKFHNYLEDLQNSDKATFGGMKKISTSEFTRDEHFSKGVNTRISKLLHNMGGDSTPSIAVSTLTPIGNQRGRAFGSESVRLMDREKKSKSQISFIGRKGRLNADIHKYKSRENIGRAKLRLPPIDINRAQERSYLYL